MDCNSPIINRKIIPMNVNQSLSKPNTPASSGHSSTMSVKTVTSNNSMLTPTTTNSSNSTLKATDNYKISDQKSTLQSEEIMNHNYLNALKSNNPTESDNSFFSLVELSQGLGHTIEIPKSIPSSGTNVNSTDNEYVIDVKDFQETNYNSDNQTEPEHPKLTGSLETFAATTTYLSPKPNSPLNTGHTNVSCCDDHTNNESIITVKNYISNDQCGDTKISQQKRNSKSYDSSVFALEQPHHASNLIKKRNKKILKKRIKQDVLINNMKSKLQHPKYCIAKRLEKYQRRSKNNCKNNKPGKMYSDDVSTVVSQLKVLKKMPANVNLLDNSNNKRRKTSSLNTTDSNSTEKNPSGGQLGHHPLIHKKSSQFNNDNTKNSRRLFTETPIKTYIIDDTNHKPNDQVMEKDTGSNETFTCSSNSFVPEVSVRNVQAINPTLVNTQFESESSSGNVSSEPDPKSRSLKKSLILNSTANKENISNDVESNQMCGDSEKAVLLNTVMDLNFYIESSPCTSSTININKSKNDAKLMDYFSCKSEKDDETSESTTNVPNNVLFKPIERKNETLHTKIDLPNDFLLKADLEHYRKITCSQEVNHPLNASMWDTMISTLDVSIKKMEDRLLQNVLKEIHRSLSVFEEKLSRHKAAASFTDAHVEDGLPRQSTETASKCEVDTSEIGTVQQVQCNIVHSKVLDNLMRDLSVQFPVPLSLTSLKFKKSVMVSDSSEIIKPTAVLADMGRGETVATSTVTSLHIRTNRTLHGFRRFFYNHTVSLRENLVVLVSIPIFFIIIVSLYGFFVLISNI